MYVLGVAGATGRPAYELSLWEGGGDIEGGGRGVIVKPDMRHCWNFVNVWIWGLGQRLEKCWQGAAICDALYLYFFFFI